MNERESIRKKIKILKEEELRKTIKLVLEEKGFKEVRIMHGSQEFGKDIVFCDEDKLKRKTWTACVVKCGDIKQPGNVFEDILRQIRECFDVKLSTHNNGDVEITNVIVISNGRYMPNVKTMIKQAHGKAKKYIDYWDLEDIVDHVCESKVKLFLENEDVSMSKYRQNIHKKLKIHSNLKFLESDFEINIDKLEELNLDVRAKVKKLEDERKNYLQEQSFKTINPRDIIPNAEALLAKNKNLLIQGTPTSGKTGTLKKIGKLFLDNDNKSLVFFLELNKVCKDKSFDLISEIKNEYKLLSSFDIDEKIFVEYRKLVLLDALDEIHNIELKDVVIEQIELFLAKYSNSRVIISSRESDYLSMNAKINLIFETYRLLPLDVKEMIDIGKNIIESKATTTEFINIVKKNELIRSFPKTPFTTILFAILMKENHLNTKELPKNITELYSKFTDIFLDKWDKSKGISEQFRYKEKQFVLQNIARYLHSKNEITIGIDELKDFLKSLSNKYIISVLKDVDKFIEDICDRSSIFINVDDSSFRFFHLTIQEYLASGAYEQADENDFIERYLNEWWLNPIIFYVGRNPERFSLLKNIAEQKIILTDLSDKFVFLIHTTKILQSAHMLGNNQRVIMLRLMLSVFDSFVKEFINNIEDYNLFKTHKTMLDVILWSRSTFMDFFFSEQYTDCLKTIWKEDVISNSIYTDITEYCLSFRLSKTEKESDYLFDFVLSKKSVNPRWYRIVEVDVEIFKMNIPDSFKKIKSNIKSKAVRNKKYIMQQFNQKIQKHKNSISGL